jgi:hypothetical protein
MRIVVLLTILMIVFFTSCIKRNKGRCKDSNCWTISGIITDNSNNLIKGAKIKFQYDSWGDFFADDGGLEYYGKTKSNSNGNYSQEFEKPNRYGSETLMQLTVSKNGYKDFDTAIDILSLLNTDTSFVINVSIVK